MLYKVGSQLCVKSVQMKASEQYCHFNLVLFVSCCFVKRNLAFFHVSIMAPLELKPLQPFSCRTQPLIIPFRESKLTRLFQGFFCGKGRASMIVNVNMCASMFDETFHVMKFSAIAKKVLDRQ